MSSVYKTEWLIGLATFGLAPRSLSLTFSVLLCAPKTDLYGLPQEAPLPWTFQSLFANQEH